MTAPNCIVRGILLQRLEHSINTARNAEDALKLVEAVHPALIITQITVTGMRGGWIAEKYNAAPQAVT